jgi:hypothetical protein
MAAQFHMTAMRIWLGIPSLTRSEGWHGDEEGRYFGLTP